MYLLSFLLTADLTKAEDCFVSGLEDSVKGSYVFRDWARLWARRTIIRNAVRMLAPRANPSAGTAVPGDSANCGFERAREADAAIASILGLEKFERIVFVLSVLERYSDQDCSVLLGCSRQDVGEARIRALQHVAESVASRRYCFENVDGQRQSYNSTASRALEDPSRTAVRLDNCIHKGKPETMPGRMFPFYEAIEGPATNLRRESRAIVFDHEFC
jgi:hypothetical protein